MRLFVIVALAGGCGGGEAAIDAVTSDATSSEVCTPFSVTAPGSLSFARPVWTGSEWAVGRPGTYTRITESGDLTTTPLPDLLDEPLAWDGVELGYYVQMPEPHIALFSPGDVTTVHAGPSIGTVNASATADIVPDPSRMPKLEAYFTEHANSVGGLPTMTLGKSDGWVGPAQPVTWALALDPKLHANVYAKYTGGPGLGDRYAMFIGIAGSNVPLDDGVSQTFPAGHVDVTATDDEHLAIVRGPRTWKIENGVVTEIPAVPPLAWNGDVFVTYATGAAVFYDAGFQPVLTRSLAAPVGNVIGTAATRRRVLFILTTDDPQRQRYVQICL